MPLGDDAVGVLTFSELDLPAGFARGFLSQQLADAIEDLVAVLGVNGGLVEPLDLFIIDFAPGDAGRPLELVFTFLVQGV